MPRLWGLFSSAFNGNHVRVCFALNGKGVRKKRRVYTLEDKLRIVYDFECRLEQGWTRVRRVRTEQAAVAAVPNR